MKHLFVILFLLVALVVPAQDRSLGERLIDAIDGDIATARTFVGVLVTEADTGRELFARFEHRLFTPASNAKLYTSAAALDTWGPDHRFRTELLARGTLAEDGTLNGDLVLVGGGDPVLRSEHLRALAARVPAELGIRAVAGRVVIDDSLYAPRLKGPGWMWDDEPDAYQMSVTALMLDYNVLTVRLFEHEGRVASRLDPAADMPPIVNAMRDLRAANVTREPFTDVILVRPAAGEAPFQPTSVNLTMHQPSPWIASVFTRMLADAGVVVHGHAIPTGDAAPIARLAHDSAPLREILALFNKPSENAIGEMLLHNLAVHRGTVPATWSAGEAALRDWLVGTAGLEADSFRIADGSGLTRYSQITPAGTVTLLTHMWNHPHRVAYLESLPVGGVDGSMRGRLVNTPAQARVFAKTGTMGGVSSLSGYVQTTDGKWRIFSILTNGFVGSSRPARDLQDRICVELVQP
ncbi:MAG: D-alanyl-D-alanine carboxypeptidase/D-alanyl-D-alanine-endopeptidase [Candidatus Sumerlaeia bacterium]|nr:D-alanyl-D-alanine carboxypeptidase/D-alanyl-D-alanine-endopeptidase [Candidatus Sumerlaeia bacterium]